MFLMVQNDPHCPPGGCSRLLASSGHPFRTVAAYAEQALPDPAALTGVIVLGGEMGVHDTERFPHLLRVRGFMSQALQAGTPLLGICLGGQLLAQLAGGLVSSPSPHGEKGVRQVNLNQEGAGDPLFLGLPTPFVTFQLHNDSFTVPPGATLLADSASCPAQAFRLGSNAYGVQFHPEVDRAIVSAWGALSAPPVDFLSGFIAAELPFSAASHAIIANFISLAAASRRS
ncbi:MAG: fused gamma-glutamyl-gamma-aminobutyrate hydrolase/peptidase [Geobacteraceae bacterium GWC2_58_44]|nr:MAG: fused gamma-glutamyl-gamma-aminobutyrate hydrolase/peptidase [Geobacteraceae bacterium GWC2_58_44]